MNKTTNYQLNQWERTDKVQMEDFNADNAKLDAAIRAEADARAAGDAALDAARRSDLLGAYKFPAGGRTLDLNISRSDLSKYVSLEVRVSKFVSNIPFNIHFTLNGLKGCYNDQSNYTSKLNYAGTIMAGEWDGVYTGCGTFRIELDAFCLMGQCVNLTERSSYSGSMQVYRIDWGAPPRSITRDTFTTINLFTNNDTTFITGGGMVYLVGNRF